MRVLAVHPSPLMYTKIYLRLEPLGLELVAGMVRKAGHDVQLIDLQVEGHRDYFRRVGDFAPDVIAFSCNYLANVPEIVDLAKATKAKHPRVFIVIGGHSASFAAEALIAHGDGAVDAVLKGEGEAGILPLLAAIEQDRGSVHLVPGAVTAKGTGPRPHFAHKLDDVLPARDLVRHRRKYFIGVLDPCASIEFSRGCPWDCTFCSAWTFYGRSYRMRSTECIVDELSRIREPGVFIVDDVAFIQAEQGMAIGEAVARAGIKKKFYLETRGDVLLRNKEVFQFWRKLGVEYMFLGLEAIDAEGLAKYRKRVPLGRNFEALEFARSLGIMVAINIIADPSWDRDRFAAVRQWCLEIPEVVNISVLTPYPGTEIWHREVRRLTTRDYRLFDIQHAVLPTTLPLAEFYRELVETQQVLNRKHLGWARLRSVAGPALRLLLRRQTNFLGMLWSFDSVFNPALQLADHERPVHYQLPLPPATAPSDQRALYIHRPKGRRGRALDQDTERFVDQTRLGESAAASGAG